MTLFDVVFIEDTNVRLSIMVLMIAGLAGCVSPTLPVYTATERYERPDWFGSNVTGEIEGSAFFRTVGGDLRTCAGNEVTVIPVTPYASERFQFIYGNTVGGSYIRNINSPGSTPIDPNYLGDWLTTLCDVSGRFSFEDAPVGPYYVTTQVVWMAGAARQGGPIFKKIVVEEGKTTRVVITP